MKAVLAVSAAVLFVMWVRYAGGKRIAQEERRKLAEAEHDQEVKQQRAAS